MLGVDHAQANTLGPATAQVIAELLAAWPIDRLRSALRILKLADHHTAPRLEAACVRGLAFGDASLPALKRILAEGLEQWPLPATPLPAADETLTYARSVEELTDTILGGAPWN